jgi:uncharacterized membrane protein YjgN (DUF898 family)
MDKDSTAIVTEDVAQRHEVSLRFEGLGLDLFGWWVLWILTMIAVAIPEAWRKRAVYRWLTRNTKASDGSTFGFQGVPKEIWFWFPLQGILSIVRTEVDITGLKWLLGILGAILTLWVEWRVLKWYAEGILVRERISFAFSGGTWRYIGWQLLSMASTVSIVGWAWVSVAIQRWIYRHMLSNDVELRFDGAPTELLRLGLLNIGLPTAIVALTWWQLRPAFWPIVVVGTFFLPWLVIPILRWYIRNTTLLIRDAEVTPEAATETLV